MNAVCRKTLQVGKPHRLRGSEGQTGQQGVKKQPLESQSYGRGGVGRGLGVV